MYNKKYEKIAVPYHHFDEINEDYINMKNLLNIFIDKCKETFNYDCVCKKMKHNFLTKKTKYTIISFPKFLFILFNLIIIIWLNIKII